MLNQKGKSLGTPLRKAVFRVVAGVEQVFFVTGRGKRSIEGQLGCGYKAGYPQALMEFGLRHCDFGEVLEQYLPDRLNEKTTAP